MLSMTKLGQDCYVIKVRILEELKACYEFVHLEFVYA